MAGARHWRQDFHPRGQWLAACLLAALAAGCKSSTWAARPSWLGGTPPPASTLADAPALDKDVTKPSATAKPYPTTDKPDGYSLNAPGSGPSAAALVEPSSVTYGATPPAAPPQTAAVPPASQPESIGPQVGPYAALQPSAPAAAAGDPAAAATAGLAAAPAFGEAPPPATTRIADAGGTSAWQAPPPAAGADPRYGQVVGSRFATGGQAAGTPPAVPAPPIEPAAPAAPAASPPGPPLVPPTDPLPGGIAPPRRRPDPGYRPAGTSSYRPSQAILAGDDAAGGVVPVSLEAGVP